MATAIKDTLRLAHKLEDAGMPRAQAEKTASAFAEELGGDELATKADVAALRSASSADLATESAALKAELKKDIELAASNLKASLLMWLIPLLLGQIAIFAAVVDWLGRR